MIPVLAPKLSWIQVRKRGPYAIFAENTYFRSRSCNCVHDRPRRLAVVDLFQRHSRITASTISRSTGNVIGLAIE